MRRHVLCRAFDLLNSHSPRADNFKAPLRQASFSSQKQQMLAISQRLMTLKLPNGRLAVLDGRRMSVLSMAFSLKSIAELVEMLFQRDICR